MPTPGRGHDSHVGAISSTHQNPQLPGAGTNQLSVVGLGLPVDASALKDGSVTTAKIAAAAVTAAKQAVFVSAEQTGTGAPQNVAHGLGVVPAKVLVAPTDTNPATLGQYTLTEGAHDATNVVVTVTSGKKFKVYALA